MTSAASALWRQAKIFLSWDENSYAEEPGLDESRLVHVGSARFVAIPTGNNLALGSRAPKHLTILDAGDLTPISGAWLTGQLEAFKACDTFQPEFLRGILFTTSAAENVPLDTHARTVLRDTGVEWTSVLSTATNRSQPIALRPGPHLNPERGLRLHELRRLHDDTHECFVTAAIQPTSPDPTQQQQQQQPFQPLPFTSTAPRATAPAIAVPSRLTKTTTTTTTTTQPAPTPLAGLRLAIKDNIDLAGLPTTLCNASYATLHREPRPATAPCVQRLVDAGATVVGKTRLASFAATEEPVECVDWSAPRNPRGDGYQSPAGSSSGSAAAVAAYAWLDGGVGSDTSGSGRRPAVWNGVVAMRPSRGVLPMDGVVPSFERFDVPTLFAREFGLCRRLVDVWYGKELLKVEKGDELPVKVVLPMDYLAMIGNKDQLRLIENFVSDMEKYLHVEAQRVELESWWAEDPPDEAGGRGLSDYMEAACRDSFWYDDFHGMDEFRSGYEEKFRRKPYVSPPVRWQWSHASKITQGERDYAINRLEVYRQWFTEKVMKVRDSNTIVILPVEEISPRYRDEPAWRKFYPTGVPMLFLSPIVGGPELTIPIGQVPYDSKVTGREEFLPVGISLMASPGYDLVLMDLMLKCLEHSNRPTNVQAGQHLFSGP